MVVCMNLREVLDCVRVFGSEWTAKMEYMYNVW